MYSTKWPMFTDTMIDHVAQVLRSGRVNQWTGTKVTSFERKFSEYFGVKHSVAVFNGTVALDLCLKAIDLEVGDEVIVTSRTFIASASCINSCGGVPVFIDVDPVSQNVTLPGIQVAVTEKTKAVILVHLAGWPCEMEEIVAWCRSQGIYVVEDCAQAHGAKYKGKSVGTWGDINAWSFCQDKILTTGGEGGMVTTDNTDLFLKAWSYKDHGKNYHKTIENKGPVTPGLFRWIHDSLGTNWRMLEIQASIGIDALDHLDEWVRVRRRNASIFNEILQDVPSLRLTIPDDRFYHSYYKYYCFLRPSRLSVGVGQVDVIAELNGRGVPCFQGTCGEVYREGAYGLQLNHATTRELSETSLMFLVDPTYSSEVITELAHLVRRVLLSHTNPWLTDSSSCIVPDPQ